MATSAWDGSGTQEDLMYRDECILVLRPAPLGHRRSTLARQNLAPPPSTR